MNSIKNLITTVLLILYLISFNSYAAESVIENETPFRPTYTDEKEDEDSDDNKADNSVDSGDTEKGGSSGGSGGGGSYRPAQKTDNKDKTQQVITQTESNVMKFYDIKQDDWFYSDVLFVFNNEIMTGTGESEFSPYNFLTRAMMITILHRIDGDNSVYGKGIFNDIEENSWYENAVNWGYENKIIAGTSENTFSPMDNLTREQLCVMLYNYTKYIGVKTEFSDISSYSDNDTVSDWAENAVSWAVYEKIITGKGDSLLAPKDSATRAETAAVIRRYSEKIQRLERK